MENGVKRRRMANTDYFSRRKPLLHHELWVQILSFVEPHSSILECRRVCKMWKHIVENEIWIYKIRRRKPKDYPIQSISEENEFIRNTPWYILFKITSEDDIFQRNNLIAKNGWGHKQDSSHWIDSCRAGSNIMTKTFASPDKDFTPEMSDDIGENNYYVTPQIGYNTYEKLERIDLPTHGLTEFILNEIKPDIHIGMWSCFSPGSEEEFQFPSIRIEMCARISYLTSSGEHRCLTKVMSMTHLERNKWTKLEIKFSNCEFQVKRIRIGHLARGQPDIVKNAGLTVRFETEKFYRVDWKSIMNHNYFTCTPIVPSNSAVSDSRIRLQYPWYSNYEINKKQPFGRNLLPSVYNICFARFCRKHRDDLSCSVLTANKWHRCILHKSGSSAKECQETSNITLHTFKIDLRDYGLFDFIRDELQPRLTAFHRSNPEDSKTVYSYTLTFSLWDKEEKLIASRTVHWNTESLNGQFQPCIRIKCCGKGERYFVFSVKVKFISKPLELQIQQFFESCYVGLSLNDN